MTITLRNESAKSQIVKALVVKIDASSGAVFIAESACGLSGRGEPNLAPGESYSLTCRFPTASSEGGKASGTTQAETSGWRFPHWYSSLFSAEVRLSIAVDVESVGNEMFYPVVIVPANETSIFVGGVLGALLLAVFVLVERLLRNPEWREAWLQSIGVTLLMGLRGGLLAVIALLVSKTTQGAGSPLQLTVTDFAGGLLVGLFSYPLASWISSTLKLDGLFLPVSAKAQTVQTPAVAPTAGAREGGLPNPSK